MREGGIGGNRRSRPLGAAAARVIHEKIIRRGSQRFPAQTNEAITAK
jgi:hypothetical protein